MLIAIVSILALIARNSCKSDSRCGRLITNAKKKIFYGMLIRYILVNALKLNFTFIEGQRESTGNNLSLDLLIILQTMPIFFSCVLLLISKDNNMGNEVTEQKFGNLYREFNPRTPAERRAIKIYYWVFFVRRLGFGMLTIYCFDFPIL